MKPTKLEAGQFEIAPISNLTAQNQLTRSSTFDTYQGAFASEPYNEAFSDSEVEVALQYILDRGGDLLLGKLGGEVVSLAGGYNKSNDVYYIEELAVTPEQQGRGFGRATLGALLREADKRQVDRCEIRTTTKNDRAIELYESMGFVFERGYEVVAQRRLDGQISLDERVYLSKPSISERERRNTLKRTAIAYPSGNTTAIVFDQLSYVDRKTLNESVMSAWKSQSPSQPEIEQCCFVTLPRDPEAVARVEMFGGEFCGNAARSVAWMVTKGKNYTGLIEVSGVERPLEFRVNEGEVKVEMPLPKDKTLVQQVAEGSLVQLDGISQLVVTQRSDEQTPRDLLTALLKSDKYGLASQPAVGVSYYDQTSGKAEFCVWVKDLDTIFDETACGSGTSAIGVALADETGQSVNMNVIQPSGETIRTEASYTKGRVNKSFIAGEVAVLYDGEYKLT